jgi:hypothetical protein
MMRLLFNPNDWLAQRPALCLFLLFVLWLSTGMMTDV